jgi:hypothetical protein
MFDKSNWANWLGNIGIVFGLVFVGFQMQQDRELKSLEFIAQTLTEYHDATIASIGEDPYRAIVKAAYQPSEMTPEELYIYKQYLKLRVHQWNKGTLFELRGIWEPTWQDNIGLSPEYGTELGKEYVFQLLDERRFDERRYSSEFSEKLRAEVQSPGFTSGLKEYLQRSVDGD